MDVMRSLFAATTKSKFASSRAKQLSAKSRLMQTLTVFDSNLRNSSDKGILVVALSSNWFLKRS